MHQKISKQVHLLTNALSNSSFIVLNQNYTFLRVFSFINFEGFGKKKKHERKKEKGKNNAYSVL